MSEPTWFDDDPDPTGVRILLAAQPDPGPMPAIVSDRILAAFAEAGRRADLDAEAGSAELSAELGLALDSADNDMNPVAGQHFSESCEQSTEASRLRLVGPGSTADPTSSRQPRSRSGAPVRAVDHRRRLTVLGGAAASVAALGLVGALLSHQSSGSATSTARAESVAGAAKNASGAAPAAADAGAPAPQAPTLKNANGVLMHIELSTRSYTKATLARLAQDMLDLPGPELGQPAVESPAVGPIGTQTGLTDCITTLGEGDSDAVYADLATFEGTSAVMIVVVDNGLKQAYAVSRSCSKGDPGLLYGPVDMP